MKQQEIGINGNETFGKWNKWKMELIGNETKELWWDLEMKRRWKIVYLKFEKVLI